MYSPSERITNLLLALATAGLLGTLICAWGWVRSAWTPVGVEDLTAEERQALVEGIVSANPGVFEPAWFEPRIAYTLRRGVEIEAWGSTFTSNRLGYRTGSPEKAPGTFRLLFVGDSWTFGMGVSREESFPEVVAALAREHAGLGERVEAWTLALPGYNTINQMAALWFFCHELAPDAVVISPTDNDNHSSAYILPNGSPWRDGLVRDLFGEPHSVTYRTARLDSYRFHERWREAFGRIREAEERLARLGVPVMLYFAARWEEERAHYWVEEAGLGSPYVVAPPRLTLGRWRNPPPFGHGTAAAHRLYAHMVYQGLAELLGWPRLPEAGHGADVPLHRRPPEGDWFAAYGRIVGAWTREQIPETFRRDEAEAVQSAGPFGQKTGRMGRATTLLVRHREGSRALRISLRRLPGRPQLYPMRVRLRIPSPGGGSREDIALEARGPALQSFELPIPADLPSGSALDVVIEAELTAAAKTLRRGHSLIVESIEPVSASR